MPVWFYEVRPLFAALCLIGLIEVVSLIGLLLVRRFVLPHFHYHDGVNDAVSGTVQAIGVFYGITIGLIAVGVWNSNSEAANLVSREATAIGSLYRDVSGYPEPIRSELRAKLREYTVYLIEQAWPAQKNGQNLTAGGSILEDFQSKLQAFEPTSAGQTSLHNETLTAYNAFVDARRQRNLALDTGLSTIMWSIIWFGAAISIGIAYFFRLEDLKLHVILIALMAGFLALVIFMIVINDRPFYGYDSVSPEPYQQVLDRLIDLKK